MGILMGHAVNAIESLSWYQFSILHDFTLHPRSPRRPKSATMASSTFSPFYTLRIGKLQAYWLRIFFFCFFYKMLAISAQGL